MSTSKVTFLFGAGASALAMPTVKQLPKRIKEVRDFVLHQYNFDADEVLEPEHGIKFSKLEAKNYLINGLDELIVHASNHSTIDTYAKQLYITSSYSQVCELMFFLSFYFNLEQKISGLDPRYTTFLVSILDTYAYRFPNNVKFISWNYDLQLEAAHALIADKGANGLPFSFFHKKEARDLVKGEFCSIKINGSSTYYEHRSDYCTLVNNILVSKIEKSDLDFAMSFGYGRFKAKTFKYINEVNLSFAWYHDRGFLNSVSEVYNETDVLVVIGYSFPFFNREVDRLLIRNMKSLKKIYIQDCEPNKIKSRFLSILPDWEKDGIEIISVDDVSEFFLPPEL